MAGKKILVVDDEKDSILFVQSVLENNDFNVIAAEDGNAGLEKAIKETPDLIVLDIQMPKMDGFQVFEELRKQEATKNIPVIMLTGIQDRIGIGFSSDDMQKFIGKKPEGYLEKPIEPDKLTKMVEEALNK
jgi:CheY-like chemotaxis protein